MSKPLLQTFLALSALVLLGADHDEFRYVRAVEVKPGFAALELPVEVLSAAAADLRDVRIVAAGKEVPYALETRITPAPVRLPLVNVESQPNYETRALVDRGASPGFAAGISLEVGGTRPFLKPVVVEGSDQRDGFREIGRGSIFRNGDTASLRLWFPASDRRYLRIRFDDRLSPPIAPQAVVFEQASREPPGGSVVEAICEPRLSETDSTSLCVATLPSANLPATSIELEVNNPVFQRQVRVFELILFRNQLSRRLLVEGTIERTINGQGSVSLPLSELGSNRLELEVERSGNTLDLSSIRLKLSPKRLIFLAPEGGPIELLYGSAGMSRPHYDLEAVLRKGMPSSLEPAILGPVADRGDRSALPSLPRGPTLDAKEYRERRAVQLPQQGPLAYLDVPGLPTQRVHGLRIVDAEQRQVPFVVEPTQIRERVQLGLSDQLRGRITSAHITGIDEDESLVLLELDASEPALFQRQVRVFEPIRDQRGVVRRRLLGEAQWAKHIEDKSARLRLALAPATSSELSIEIDNGDNPPVWLSEVVGEVARTRIDFLFTPGEPLWLWYSPSATWPNYDLTLLSERLFASPAQGATLGKREVTMGASEGKRPVWFWLAFLMAAGLILALLARLVRGGVRAE